MGSYGFSFHYFQWPNGLLEIICFVRIVPFASYFSPQSSAGSRRDSVYLTLAVVCVSSPPCETVIRNAFISDKKKTSKKFCSPLQSFESQKNIEDTFNLGTKC
ncbi:hypothetical protein PAXRUDRAFT_828192 [Paxillus rubicundulus Ve08.2h10]|uniref:Uncharacterized protein n=1 Tax=Paxillus rubicundulus Ve08.2h10 TaxID=930991 RepID=A0A0D0E1J9_9AGAM|nr:hypothetical protein PAXRUDRAFT_828192 [Paxillus rubicundulus Ve08.2h10]